MKMQRVKWDFGTLHAHSTKAKKISMHAKQRWISRSLAKERWKKLKAGGHAVHFGWLFKEEMWHLRYIRKGSMWILKWVKLFDLIAWITSMVEIQIENMTTCAFNWFTTFIAHNVSFYYNLLPIWFTIHTLLSKLRWCDWEVLWQAKVVDNSRGVQIEGILDAKLSVKTSKCFLSRL